MNFFYSTSVFFWAITANCLFSQTTFNKRQIFGFEAAVMTSIIPTDSCYYATGIIADTIFPYNTGNIFVKYKLNGEVDFFKTITAQEKTYETWFNDLILLENGDFAIQGYTVDSTTKTIFLKFDEFGDTLFTKEYFNPLYPSYEFIQPRGGMILTPDNGFVIFSSIRVSNLPNVDLHLLKVDGTGNKLWDQTYPNGLWDRSQSILLSNNNSIVIGAVQTNTNLVNENYTYQTQITSLDSLGNENWTYLSPVSVGLRDAANDMVLLEDGSLVVASGIGHEQDWPSVNAVYFEKYVFKLNPDREVEWELIFPDPLLTGKARVTNVEAVSDGSGFVFAGAATTPELNAHAGWIAKVSPTGLPLWERRYVYLTDTFSDNKIFGLKETPDGGFILCGEARDIGDMPHFPQQAWLLKLDRYGCLVPGCHLLDNVGEAPAPSIHLAVYPNPVSDYLNFEIKSSGHTLKSTVRITGMDGQVVKMFNHWQPDATNIIPVWDWPAGTYVLQYLEDGLVRASERFVVLKK